MARGPHHFFLLQGAAPLPVGLLRQPHALDHVLLARRFVDGQESGPKRALADLAAQLILGAGVAARAGSRRPGLRAHGGVCGSHRRGVGVRLTQGMVKHSRMRGGQPSMRLERAGCLAQACSDLCDCC